MNRNVVVTWIATALWTIGMTVVGEATDLNYWLGLAIMTVGLPSTLGLLVTLHLAWEGRRALQTHRRWVDHRDHWSTFLILLALVFGIEICIIGIFEIQLSALEAYMFAIVFMGAFPFLSGLALIGLRYRSGPIQNTC